MVKALIEIQPKADLQTVGQLPVKMVIVILKQLHRYAKMRTG